MATLTLTELNQLTNTWVKKQGKKAIDVYGQESFATTMFIKDKAGLWERPPGGRDIQIPLEYDEAIGGFYSKGDTLDSTDREMIENVYFQWKHAYSTATIYRLDGLQNAGEYAILKLFNQRMEAAKKKIRKIPATTFYDGLASGKGFTGILPMMDADTTVKYGDKSGDEIVAADGEAPWVGNTTTTSTTVSLANIRALRSSAWFGHNPSGEPDIGLTTKAIYDKIKGLLDAQRQFVKSDATATKLGFLALNFEGMDIAPDRYCPSGLFAALNKTHFGYAFHKQGLFKHSPWRVIEGSPEDKTMKIYLDGNQICNNRRAHACYTNFS